MPSNALLVGLLVVAPTASGGLAGRTLARHAPRSALAIRRRDREVDVLLRVHTHHELRDVHQLLPDAGE